MLLFAANLALAQRTPDAVVAKDLQAYYDKGEVPPWAEAIKNLTAEKPERHAIAAKYLVALLDQAQTDELSGKAPWRPTPHRPRTRPNPPRPLPPPIAQHLPQAPPHPA